MSESHDTISMGIRAASCMARALLPDAVGPTMASARTRPGAGERSGSDPTKATLDLREGQAQQHGAPVRAMRAQVDPVELGEESDGLRGRQRVSSANDAVTGHGGEDVIEPLGGRARQGRSFV